MVPWRVNCCDKYENLFLRETTCGIKINVLKRRENVLECQKEESSWRVVMLRKGLLEVVRTEFSIQT